MCFHYVTFTVSYVCLCLTFPPFCEHTWALCPLILSACAWLFRVPLQNLITKYFFLLFRICFSKTSALVWDSDHLRCLAYGLLLENSDLWTALAASRSFSIETWTESGKSSQLSSAVKRNAAEPHFHHLFGDFPVSLLPLNLCSLFSVWKGPEWLTSASFFLKSSLTCRRSVCLLAHCQDVCARHQAVFVEWFVIIHRHPWGKTSRHLCKHAAPSTDELQCSENIGESENTQRMKITHIV